MIPKTLTLDHHLVTGYQYLLPVAGLCILQDSGARLGGSCRVGHGQRLKALHAICTVVGQLNGATLCDCDCVIGKKGTDAEWEGTEEDSLSNREG